MRTADADTRIEWIQERVEELIPEIPYEEQALDNIVIELGSIRMRLSARGQGRGPT